jgi:hypothetical protein
MKQITKSILCQHLTTISGDQSPKDLSSVSLKRLRLFVFAEIVDKPELDELIVCKAVHVLLPGL